MRKYAFAIIAGILVLFASLGLGRFAFGMVLPSMQTDLGINITQSGFIGTSNFLGYLGGLLFSGAFYSKFGAPKLIVRSLLTQGLFMFLMTLGSSYISVSFFYFFAGFFGALANMSIMAYITQIVPKDIRGKAVGILTVGNGSAIVFSGYIVPYMESIYKAASWKITWGIFAAITMLIAFIISPGLKHDNPHANVKESDNEPYFEIFRDIRFIRISGIYFCFGITYVVYVTFFVLASMDKWHISSSLSAPFWILLGFLSMFSGALFGILADKIGRWKTLSVVFLIQSISNLIMALDMPSSYLWVSASLFGISVWATPSIMAVLTAETFGMEKTAKIFSKITIIFALGQIIGPVGAGYLTDITKNFSYAFGVSSILTFLAFIGSSYIILKNDRLI
ncbi:MAG: YbfB/YjiJ family MFS transporter [Sulfurospirillaceae bacterium]|nr:YbfB/YjiJ family MFS transporter [Sulfurospirillaceae bacterium]